MSDLIKKASEQLNEIIMNALGCLVANEAVPSVPLPAFNIEIPADKSHGDFATNAAMVCARSFKMSPRKIAELYAMRFSSTAHFSISTKLQVRDL